MSMFRVQTNNNAPADFPTLRKARSHQKKEAKELEARRINYESTISCNGKSIMFRANYFEYGRV